MTADGSLASRVCAAPLAFDRERARAVVEALPEALASGPMGELLLGTAGSSPYLGGLIEREAEWLAEAAGAAPEDALETLLAAMQDPEIAEPRALATALRRARARGALVVALADLGGVWQLGEVTGALTRLADTALEAAVRLLLGVELRQDRLPGLGEDDLASGAGYAVIAMGKLGARELNFSSDIDLICLFDQDRFEAPDFAQAKARYIHVTRQLVRLISQNTDEGYVFRTDLRLRPSPSTTPICMAMEAAERYYESVGRTWERAAYIKARTAAGDAGAGGAWLEGLNPFVWRRYLDFAAIEDTHEMLRKIREQKGRFSPGALPGSDIKLGPGGIREIEFFVQTRQLICGGREPALRVPATLDALEALAGAGWVEEATAETLAADYAAHRTLEHRLQMMDDAQTHILPRSGEARDRLAALSGWSDRAKFERDVAERRARVHAATEEFFGPAAGPGAKKKSRPEITEDYLDGAGFQRPADAMRLIETWRGANMPATRSARARGLLRKLEPLIVERLADAGSPDEAMAQFDRFLAGLPAGVQVFSLFSANPHLLDLIVEICAAAPRLAGYLAHHPQVLDALLDRDFFEPLPDAAGLTRDLEAWVGRERERDDDYERLLDAVRRWAHEQVFRAGVQVLRGMSDAAEAGRAFTAIAEAALAALFPRVVAEFARRHGPPPGRGMVVIGMGKLGSREMTAGSDLDLITVYDAEGTESSEGRKPLAASAYFPRLTQALLAALTAPTAEGKLYDVDMRLRPSGRKGPVAVSFSAFARYQAERAWVWEHLALTRARVVTGAPELGRQVEATIREALAARKGDDAVLAQAREMRAKLLEAHARERQNPWSLKYAAGGLMEIEFLAQTGTLHHGLDCRSAAAALPGLAEAGWIEAEAAETLAEALALMQGLQHIERVALDNPINPEAAGEGLRRAMARSCGAEDFDALDARLRALETRAAEICAGVFGDPGDGGGGDTNGDAGKGGAAT
ncbi:MAG TPA: bifunctional [glutamine synthetase] adenylyltransferase/[glutamine synthetase]-adenylyl-L-tyrosine phosphorylase [Thermohalobaculum sp.]|nr:bifunctional [glutamine synthetase] adenylyltransferase/[glutamine synthetase]-adenylyl-L-tyrosine phosphorylase [Thermohalobaculum sp.]